MPTREFKKFIETHAVQPGRILTHFVLSKKIKLHIPFEERDLFYHLYIDNIKKCGHDDELNSVVEKVYDKSAFNYFIDIDFDLKHFRTKLLSPEQLEQFKAALYEHIQKMISTTFGVEKPNVVTSLRSPFKLHFNFPGLVVNFETAVGLTTSLRNYMTMNFPIVYDGCHLWEKVIDTSVYNTTGLRMIWSNKGDGALPKETVQEMSQLFPGAVCSNHYVLIDQNQQLVPPNVDIVKKLSLHATNDPVVIANRFFLEQQAIDPTDDSAGTRPVYGFGDVPSDAVLAIKDHLEDNLDCINGQKVKVEISKVRRLGRDGNIEVMLMPQSCPFVMREHRRTCDGNRPSNWVLITPFKTEFRCWKCTKHIHEIDHIDSDVIEMLFDVNTHEIRARRALTRATDEAVADFIFHLVKGIHAASHCGGKNYLWYKFEHKKHRWDKRDVIIEDIMRDNGPIQKLVRKYARMIHEHEQQLSKDIALDDEPEESEEDQQEKKSKGPKQKSITDLCNALCKNLQSFSYVNNHVLPVLGLKLHNHLIQNGQTFQEQLDQNPKLLGFENGVFDFVSGEFREGKPSDMITMSTKTNYVAWENQDPAIQRDLVDFLSTLFPDNEERDYVLNELGCTLDGETTEQKFFFMTGYGANGKSTIVRLLNMSMGDYAGETNITLFTQPRPPANAPVPELICLRGKRFVTCSEPNSKDVLNFGTIKWLTGGDRITGRNLFEKQQSFYLQATFFCLCNDIPQINASDYGTWRRVRTILFSSQFVFGREPTRPNEFKADESLDQRMKKWTHAFGSLLVHFCTKRKRFAIPPKFKETYDKLRHDNDIYTRFAHDCLVVRTSEDCELLSVAEMFDVFVNWGKRFQVKGSRNVDLPLFYRNMQQILGPGIEYKTEDGCDIAGFYVEISRVARM